MHGHTEARLMGFTRRAAACVALAALAMGAVYAQAGEPRVVKNPYEGVDWDRVTAFVANFHSHTVLSDGRAEPDVLIHAYANAGYDILAVTDHDNGYNHRDGERDVRAIYNARDGLGRIATAETTWPWTRWIDEEPSAIWTYRGVESSAFYPDLGERGMLAIRGNELSTHPHAVSLFNYTGWADRSQDDDARVAEVERYDGLFYWAHPTHYVPGGPWEDRFFDDDSWETAVEYFGRYIAGSASVIGMETQHRANRMDLDRELFDRLLANYYPEHDVFIFGSDDNHSTTVPVRGAMTLVLAEELTEDAIRHALTHGHVFAGARADPYPHFNRIEVDEDAQTITVDARHFDAISWIVDGKAHATGPVLDFSALEEAVVRFELEQDGSTFFSQAFYIR